MPVSANAFDLKRITAGDAAEKLSRFAVLDARPLARWEQGHLPLARSFSWENYTQTDTDGVKYRILPPDQLAKILGGMGIGSNDAVLVYGDADSSWGGEGWLVWMLAWLGHRGTVYVLDGGIQAWQGLGKSLTTARGIAGKKKTYTVKLTPSVGIGHERIKAEGRRVTLIDTRGYLTEWLPGHLPDAVHIPWEKFYDGPHRTVIRRTAMEALFRSKHVDPQKPLVFYCTGGIRSGFAWMAAVMNGYPAVMNFEGGTEEWNRFTP